MYKKIFICAIITTCSAACGLFYHNNNHTTDEILPRWHPLHSRGDCLRAGAIYGVIASVAVVVCI